ncbi:MAG: HEAT repeat domain-containing protein [Anaerolineales bacterium]|nr:HEAT repeat domain-containing protein [Anaerolineales bacterium]
MNHILETFKIKSGEERISALLVGLMLITAAGGTIGGIATEALFFARFGVEFLPNMYVILGLFTFVTSMAITVIMGRFSKQKLFIALPLIIGFALIAERVILLLNVKWFFAAMWLGMNVVNGLQGLFTWGLASAACDTRQSKRLFPLFSAGGILGTVLGGLLTQPLARWLHSENLLLVWAGTLFIAFLLSRAIIGRSVIAIGSSSRTKQPSIFVEMQRGYKFVRQSSIMQWVSYSAILFSVCYFSLALPFSRGATTQFPDADQLAGFLGLFQSITTIVALIASLFFANRLFARFGIMPMLLLFPIIYFVGFGILSLSAPFTILVSVRFMQMMWMQGIAGTAWQALFNVVPFEQRDQVRTFISGVPEQAGTFIAGLILVVGEQALNPQQLYLIGLAAAALLVYILWRASRAYANALVEALRAGQPQMFVSEEEPFGGFHTDAATVSAAIKGMNDLDKTTRLVSIEILGSLSIPEVTNNLVTALADDDALIRSAALRGLTHARASSALLDIAASLSDPEPDVRLQAVDSLRQLARYPRGVSAHIEPLLVDQDPLVRARSAQTLLGFGGHPKAKNILHEMAASTDLISRTHALNALAECRDESAFELGLSALDDANPVIRKTAPRLLVSIDPQRALEPIIHHLNDDDSHVRKALAEALGNIGLPALDSLLAALTNPSYEDSALMALEFLPAQKASQQIRTHALNTARSALHYHQLALGLAQKFGRTLSGDGRNQLLIESLHDKAHRSGLNSLRAVGLLKGRQAVGIAIENLRSRESAQRANALEVLESIGEVEIIRPLLALWESGESSSVSLPDQWLLELLHDPYSWLRACAVLVAAGSGDEKIISALKSLSKSDPDSIVRDIADKVFSGDRSMDTLATIPLMERILFLRRVPIFADLSPADLKQVAVITTEAVFADGDVLAHQGEFGDEMFIVVSGEVNVLIASEDQKEARQIAKRSMGDYVGEMSIISREPRIATLVASGQVRALCVDRKQFEGILRERPEIGMALMRTLCQRLKEASLQKTN